jgi:hypothetical protein
MLCPKGLVNLVAVQNLIPQFPEEPHRPPELTLDRTVRLLVAALKEPELRLARATAQVHDHVRRNEAARKAHAQTWRAECRDPRTSPLPPLWESLGSRRNCPKYLADGPEVGDIPVLSTACDLVEPAHRGRLQTWFGGISRGINHFDLNLDGISTATHPALALLPPFFHLPYSTR